MMKLKSELTVEESQHLIDLGVDPKLASKEVALTIWERDYNDPRHPVFRLEDVIEALPKEIDSKVMMFLSVCWGGPKSRKWIVCYDCVYTSTKKFENPELIDALYSLFCWAITNGHYKPKTEEKCTD